MKKLVLVTLFLLGCDYVNTPANEEINCVPEMEYLQLQEDEDIVSGELIHCEADFMECEQKLEAPSEVTSLYAEIDRTAHTLELLEEQYEGLEKQYRALGIQYADVVTEYKNFKSTCELDGVWVK